jgi:hypothetical protein
MIDGDPTNAENWQLKCHCCNQVFDPQTTVGALAAHWQAFHPEQDPDNPHVELEWIGIGPTPESNV